MKFWFFNPQIFQMPLLSFSQKGLFKIINSVFAKNTLSSKRSYFKENNLLFIFCIHLSSLNLDKIPSLCWINVVVCQNITKHFLSLSFCFYKKANFDIFTAASSDLHFNEGLGHTLLLF
jgi:hypothetical protein